jgi:hypothetical protein
VEVKLRHHKGRRQINGDLRYERGKKIRTGRRMRHKIGRRNGDCKVGSEETKWEMMRSRRIRKY